MKKIIITGAAGMVGQNLTILLLKKGYSVVALDKNRHNLSILEEVNQKVTTYCVDLVEQGSWMDEFKDAHAVVDLKAQIASKDTSAFKQNNVASTKNILAACKKYKVPHLIHLSSSVVISVADDEYTRTKRAGEEMVKKSKVPHTIFRPPLMFGCFDAKHLGWLTRLMERIPIFPIPGSGKYMRQPLYVMDLCRVIESAIRKGPSNKVHNIIGHEKIDFIDMMRIIAQERGITRVVTPFPMALFQLSLKAYCVALNKPAFTQEQLDALVAGDEFPVSEWTKEFGVTYTPFRKALAEMFANPHYKYRDKLVSPH